MYYLTNHILVKIRYKSSISLSSVACWMEERLMHRWRAWQDDIWWLGGFINWTEKCGKESEIWFSKDTVDQEVKGKQLHYKSVVGDLSPSSYLHIKFMTHTVTLKHSLRILHKCSQITKHYQHLPGSNFCWHDPNGQVYCEAILFIRGRSNQRWLSLSSRVTHQNRLPS